MISSLRGTVLAVGGNSMVVEVGGIGYAVAVTPQLALSVSAGGEVLVHTALIVRDDDLSLFGFRDLDELRVFDLLRGVTGVGPKSALGVLSAMTPAQVAFAVTSEDDAAFRKVSGIGPKTAKLITISLAGKVAPPSAARPSVRSVGTDASVVAALVGLGWPEKVAGQAVTEVVAEATPDERGNTQARLRLALARLGPQRVGTP